MTTVLLVDDEPEALTAWQTICEGAGYETVTAENGEVALSVLHHQPVDVVVADWRMPVMSGSVLCHHMRNEQGLADISFVLVSGEPSPPAFVRYDGFLRKPLDPPELLQTMARLLADQRSWRAAIRSSSPPRGT
jgi:two-component system, OmpR family, response regulator ChvI